MTNTLVMIPAFNEEKTVGEVARDVKNLNPDSDVVVIDDGSSDATISEATKVGADIIALPLHAGGTTAVFTGYLAALKCGYDYLAKIDGDGQHKPEDVERVLEPVRHGEADIGVGSRYLANGYEQFDSVTKMVGRTFSSYLMNGLTDGFHLTDVTSGLRSWNRQALETLVEAYVDRRRFPDDSILWPVETMIARQKRLRLKEIPIDVLPRQHGKSKSFTLTSMVEYPYRLVALTLEVLRSNRGQ